MSTHARVQGACTRAEPLLFSIVGAGDVAHELGHAIPVIVWRTECILSNQPSGWEDHEVESGLSWVVGLDRHDCEDRRIWMVERDRPHRVEPVQIILVGDVVTVPGNDIERTTVLCALKRTSHVSIHNGPLVCRLLVGSNRRTEVSLVS